MRVLHSQLAQDAHKYISCTNCTKPYCTSNNNCASHPSIDPAQTKASLRRDLQPSKGIQDPSVVGGALTRARAPRREGKYILHKYKYKGNAARYPKENIENHIWSTPLSPPSVIMLCIDEPKRSSQICCGHMRMQKAEVWEMNFSQTQLFSISFLSYGGVNYTRYIGQQAPEPKKHVCKCKFGDFYN